MRQKNGVLYNLSILSLGQVISQLANMAALIYLADYLGARWFGIIQIGVAFMSYALIISEWGMMSLGIREVSRQDQSHQISTYVSEHMSLLAAQAGLVLLVSLFVLPKLPFYHYAPLVFQLYLAAVVIQIYLQNWVAIGLEKMTWVGVSRIVGSLVYAGLVMGLLSRMPATIHKPAAYWVPAFFLISMTCSNLVVNIPLAKWFGHFLHPRLPAWGEAKRRWHETSTIGANVIVRRVLYNIDIIMLGVLSNPETAGNYAAASRIIFQLVVAVEVLWAALLPRLSRAAKQSPQTFQTLFNLYFVYVLAVVLPISLGGVLEGNGFIHFLYKGKFPEAGPVFQILAVAYSMLALGTFLGNTLLANDQQQAYLLPLAAGSLTAISGVVWLVPKFAGQGAAWAMLTAHGLLLIIMLAINRHMFQRGILRVLVAILPGLAAMALVLYLLSPLHVLLQIAAGGLVYLAITAKPLLNFRKQMNARNPNSLD